MVIISFICGSFVVCEKGPNYILADEITDHFVKSVGLPAVFMEGLILFFDPDFFIALTF